MADAAKTVNETLAIIDSALTITNNYPKLDKKDLEISTEFSMSISPISYLVELLKHVEGYDALIKIVAKFIVAALPALELSVKAILLTNIKNMLSCSLDPLIPYEVLKNGIVVDLRKLDVLNIIEYCPLASANNGRLSVFDSTNFGKYYYFGCDCIDKEEDLSNASDFNAFLWYVKNKALGRVVWTGVNLIDATFDDSSYQTGGLFSTDVDCNKVPRQRPKPKATDWCGELDGSEIKTPKSKRTDGIITLEYHERKSALTDAEGAAIDSYVQTPPQNCLHVFIGNTTPLYEIKGSEMKNDYYKKLEEHDNKQKEIDLATNQITTMQSDIEKTDVEIRKLNKKIIESNLSEEQREEISTEVAQLTANINHLDNQIYKKTESLKVLNTELLEIKKSIGEIVVDTNFYKKVTKNYYYGRTLFEFNTEFVTSLKLFDSKVVAAQVIDAITGCLTIDLNLSYQRQFIKQEIEKIVTETINHDDATISDCFFTFSNKEYDRMLKKSELMKASIPTINGFESDGKKIDVQSLLSNLDGISDTATKEETQTVIEHCFTTISEELNEKTSGENVESLKTNVGFSFINNLLNQLAYVITTSLISPKIYLLMAINMEMLGRQTHFDVDGFIEQNRTMLGQQIKNIVDEIINFITLELFKITGNLAQLVGSQMATERIKYYRDLIQRMITCFKGNNNDQAFSFEIPNINYADIYEEEPQVIDENNC